MHVSVRWDPGGSECAVHVDHAEGGGLILPRAGQWWCPFSVSDALWDIGRSRMVSLGQAMQISEAHPAPPQAPSNSLRLRLQSELAERCAANPQYSLRSFALHLGNDHSTSRRPRRKRPSWTGPCDAQTARARWRRDGDHPRRVRHRLRSVAESGATGHGRQAMTKKRSVPMTFIWVGLGGVGLLVVVVHPRAGRSGVYAHHRR